MGISDPTPGCPVTRKELCMTHVLLMMGGIVTRNM